MAVSLCVVPLALQPMASLRRRRLIAHMPHPGGSFPRFTPTSSLLKHMIVYSRTYIQVLVHGALEVSNSSLTAIGWNHKASREIRRPSSCIAAHPFRFAWLL